MRVPASTWRLRRARRLDVRPSRSNSDCRLPMHCVYAPRRPSVASMSAPTSRCSWMIRGGHLCRRHPLSCRWRRSRVLPGCWACYRRRSAVLAASLGAPSVCSSISLKAPPRRSTPNDTPTPWRKRPATLERRSPTSTRPSSDSSTSTLRCARILLSRHGASSLICDASHLTGDTLAGAPVTGVTQDGSAVPGEVWP
jgi:hypothetical protein